MDSFFFASGFSILLSGSETFSLLQDDPNLHDGNTAAVLNFGFICSDVSSAKYFLIAEFPFPNLLKVFHLRFTYPEHCPHQKEFRRKYTF